MTVVLMEKLFHVTMVTVNVVYAQRENQNYVFNIQHNYLVKLV